MEPSSRKKKGAVGVVVVGICIVFSEATRRIEMRTSGVSVNASEDMHIGSLVKCVNGHQTRQRLTLERCDFHPRGLRRGDADVETASRKTKSSAQPRGGPRAGQAATAPRNPQALAWRARIRPRLGRSADTPAQS